MQLLGCSARAEPLRLFTWCSMSRLLFSKIRWLLSRFLRRLSFCCSSRWLAFCMLDQGPQGGELTSISGLCSSRRNFALW